MTSSLRPRYRDGSGIGSLSLRIFLSSVLLLSLFGQVGYTSTAKAQTPNNALATIPGTISWFVAANRYTTVPAPNAAQQSGQQVTIALYTRNSSDYQRVIADLSDADSASYGLQLNSSDYDKLYRPEAATVQSYLDYFKQQGATLAYRSGDDLVLSFKFDSRAAFDKAFNTSSSYVKLANDQEGYVNTTALQLPEKLASSLRGVSGQNMVTPKKLNSLKGSRMDFGNRPATLNNPDVHWPQSIRKGYDLDTVTQDGTGTTVAFTLWAGPQQFSFSRFNAQFGVQPATVVTQALGVDNTDTYADAIGEADLDIEYAHVAAPNAGLVYYVAEGPFDNFLVPALAASVNNPAVVSISNSWGGCLKDETSSDTAAYQTVFNQAVANGKSMLFSSGDDGIYNCDTNVSSGPSLDQPYSAAYPAADPQVTAVGGTTFQIDTQTFRWVNETAWSCADRSATLAGARSCVRPTGASASGGIAYNDTSRFPGSVSFTRPSYQTGGAIGSALASLTPSGVVSGTAYRVFPDISANADFQTSMYVYTANSTNPSDPGNGFFRYSGTSLSSPWLAGILALSAQLKGSGLGFINPYLYANYSLGTASNRPIYAGWAFDVLDGYLGGAYSPPAYPTVPALAKYDWDYTTGIGSVKDAGNLVYTLGNAIGKGRVHTIPPTRLYDSRVSQGGPGPISAGVTRTITVAGGSTGIPITATGIIGNLSVTNTDSDGSTGGGFLAAFTGPVWPGNATVNWQSAAQTVGNGVTLKLNGSGQLTFYAFKATEFILDVTGYIDASGAPAGGYYYHPLFPPTRTYTSTTNFSFGTTATISISGTGVPTSGVNAVLVNLTAFNTTSNGFFKAYAPGSAAPATSALNYSGTGQVATNLALVPVVNNNFEVLFGGNAAASSGLYVDVVGYYNTTATGAGSYNLLPAHRLYDSRVNYGGPGPLTNSYNPGFGPNTQGVYNYRLVGVGGVPSVLRTTDNSGGQDTTYRSLAIVLNVAVVNTSGSGYLSFFNSNAVVPPPNIRSISWNGANQIVSALVVVPVASDGYFSVFVGGSGTVSTNLVLDVVGYVQQ